PYRRPFPEGELEGLGPDISVPVRAILILRIYIALLLMSFAGLRVLSLESRRAKEMEALIVREGGVPFVAPPVKERALDDDQAAVRFVEQLEADEFDMVVCMTAVGLTLLRDT